MAGKVSGSSLRGFCTNTSSASARKWSVAQVFKSNFADSLERLRGHVDSSDFIAVWLRRTGAPSAAWHRVSCFDTLETAYSKAKEAAEKFQVLQFAVCPFEVRASKALAHPYNFHLFPRDELDIKRPSYGFTCQSSHLASMVQEGFDFNACIYDATNDKSPASFKRLGETERPLPVRKRMFGRAWPLRAPGRVHPVATWPQLLGRFGIPCFDDSMAFHWLNLKDVRKAIHVEEAGEWELCPHTVLYDRDAGSMINYHKNLTARGYRALIFSGDHDMTTPYTGTQAWTRSMGYKIVDVWRAWLSNEQVAGYFSMTLHCLKNLLRRDLQVKEFRSNPFYEVPFKHIALLRHYYELRVVISVAYFGCRYLRGYDYNLTFLTIKGAGQTVPQHKPREALEFYSRFLAGKQI